MILIEDLGMRVEGIDPRYNKPTRRRYGLFQCPICLKCIERPMGRGKKAKTCGKCKKPRLSHNMSRTRQYSIWQGMQQRCTNPKVKHWDRYGGRGIQVSPDWNTFEGFWKDMEEGYTSIMTIDRKDGNGNYCKENCRWLPNSENASDTCRKKQVLQYELTKDPRIPNILIKEWDSAKQAADTLSLTASHITDVCRGKRKTHGGFIWVYK